MKANNTLVPTRKGEAPLLAAQRGRYAFMKPLFPLVIGLLMSQISIAADYKQGQVWKYKAREGEESSLLYIVRIDTEKGYGSIYHIYVDGLRIRNAHLKGGFQSTLPHSPVDRTTLDASVTELVRETKDMPDISAGYTAWREPFDAGKAGVFNIPVNKIIEYIEQAANSAR